MTATSAAIFASIVTCMATITSGTHYPETKYVDNYCGQIIIVQSNVRIQLTSSMYLTPGQPCSVFLSPSQGSAVVATFLSYSMNPAYVNDYGDCEQESIQMTDYNGNDVLGYPNYCSSDLPPGQLNLLNQGTFGYTVVTSAYAYPANVDLLVSEVVYKQGSCPSGYFDCQNGNCVTQDVTCNGYDNCGNNNDETVGCNVCYNGSDETVGCGELAVGVIVGIAVGVSAFIVFVAVLVLLFRRYRRRVDYVQYT